MAILDRVMQMQAQGISEGDISRQLINERVSPREIQDAFNQARVKSAVGGVSGGFSPSVDNVGMTPSVMSGNFQQDQFSPPQLPMQAPVLGQVPSAQFVDASRQFAPQAQNGGNEFSQVSPVPQEQYPSYAPEMPQAYNQEGTGQEYYDQGYDQDLVSEIAGQVVDEKLDAYKKGVGDVKSFMEMADEKIKNIDSRLKKIEDSIEKLQQAVIGKIGEFGDDARAIHKDLQNLHNTTSKLMNPLIDNYREMKKARGE